jgi:signal transduction histidine kinase
MHLQTSLQNRLLFFLLLSYIPVSLVILWNYQSQRRLAIEAVQQDALQQAQQIAFFHHQEIDELENMLRLVTQTSMIQEWDMEECQQTLVNVLSQFPTWLTMTVMDTDGTVICASVPELVGANYADREYIQEAFATGQLTISDYLMGRITQRPHFALALPILDDIGTINGLMTVSIQSDVQSEHIAQEVLDTEHRVIILDEYHTIMMGYPNPDIWIGRTYDSQDVLREIGNQPEGVFHGTDLDGEKRLFGFATLEEPAGAVVIVSVAESLAFAEVNRVQRQNLLLFALTFIFTSLFIMRGTRLIVLPLRQFALTTQQFATNDLGKRINSSTSITEIKQIEQAFNAMAHSIERRIDERTAALLTMNQQLNEEIQSRKQIEAELATSMTRLQESNQDLEQFAYAASHDLREPLRKFIMFSNALQRPDLANEQRQDYLRRMLSAAMRMDTMVDNLLLYSRIDRQENTQTQVNLNVVLQNVVSDLDLLMLDTQGEVQIDPLPTIRADEIQMHQLFQNIITNALKFHRENVPPIVKVTTQEDGDSIRICIEDNGVGIAEDDVDRIFTIFERLHGRAEGGGSGIGLAICRKIMQRHGGRIAVESTVGKGTTFILHFPLAAKVS